MFRAQLVDLWDELLALAEADPGFRFLMDGQTVLIEDYLAVRPDQRGRLERAIGNGQIQVGPWYTLPDGFLTSGESLVRNLQRGLAVGDRHGGSMRVGYLPDTFGHPAQMPQLYRQFEFQHAVVWRGVPSAIDRLAFTWEAPDGSAVITAYMGTSYAHGVDLPLDGAGLAARLRTAVQALAPFRPDAHVLLMNGNDHVMPQPGLSTAAGAAGQLLGATVQVARLDDYLATLPAEGWPRWRGELRASSRANVLMGTLSVRIPDKQEYFEAGLAVERLAEPLAALSGMEADGLLREAWTLLLQNAAHDTACGSGIDAVADEARLRSRAARQVGSVVAQRGLERLAQSFPADGSPLAWNPSPFPRFGLVEIVSAQAIEGSQDLGPAREVVRPARARFAPAELPRLLALLDEQRIAGQGVRDVRFDRLGSVITVVVQTAPGQEPEDLETVRRQAEAFAATPGVEAFDVDIAPRPLRRRLVPVGPIAGMALASIAAGVTAGRDGVQVAGSELANRHLRCRVEPDGTLSVDLHGRVLYAGLNRLVDDGDAGDEYNYSPPSRDRRVDAPAGGAAVKVLEEGPLRGRLEARLSLQLPIRLQPDRQARAAHLVEMPVRMQVTLEADQRRVDIDLEVENRAEDHRLRVLFPLPYPVAHSESDTAFHVTRRPVVVAHREAGAPELELPTFPMRTFVTAASADAGLTVVTRGLHEYEVLPGPASTLAVTLLRAVGWLSRDDLAYRTGHAGPALATPGAQVPGRHQFRYSLVFTGAEPACLRWRLAECALLPLQVMAAHHAASLPRDRPTTSPSHTGFEIETETVQLTACIPAPGGYDLRLVNVGSELSHAVVRFHPSVEGATRVRLGGELIERLTCIDGRARFDMRAWEITTLQVRR